MIRATLALIGRAGPEAATVRAIAAEAGLSVGMIRHHFAGKEELVSAAYEYHMRALNEATSAAGDQPGRALDRLTAFVTAALSPPVLDPEAMALWAGFIHMVRRDPAMRDIHERTYYQFRDRLQTFIADALAEAGRTPDAAELRRLAIASNAVLDGLWLEGGALPDAFAAGELATIGRNAVAALTGLPLSATEGAS
ncbi:MAG: TetR family transcriptional regulator C-terminal domain-containing protein [Paracoccaceae bacterium]